jgi:putative sterol carrier protein
VNGGFKEETMSVIYAQQWYEDMKDLINGSDAFRQQAPSGRLAMTLEVVGDAASPYLSEGQDIHYLIVLEQGAIVEYAALDSRHGGQGLDFRFTAPASVWEEIAAGLTDPITAGLRGRIRIRGDMRYLMMNAEAVKVLVDLYGQQGYTEWPAGKPPYEGSIQRL